MILRTFFFFLLVGGIAAVIYFGLLFSFLEIFRLDYRLGVSIAYITAVSFHFFANRYLTFRANQENTFQQIVRYLPMMVLNYLLTLVIVTVLVELLWVSPYIGGGVAIVVTVGLGFFISKVWVFRKGSISG